MTETMIINLKAAGSTYTSLGEVLDNATEFHGTHGVTTVIDLGRTGVVILPDVSKASLTAAHFHWH